jgi:hypothetical protein
MLKPFEVLAGVSPADCTRPGIDPLKTLGSLIRFGTQS